MTFRFSLQSLLRVREIRERAELQSLLAIQTKISVVRAEIERVVVSLEESRRELASDATSGVAGVEFQFQAYREETIGSHIKQLTARLAELQTAEQAQQQRHRQARQLREVISTLRENQFVAFKHEQSRREQQSQDDLFLSRLPRHRAD